MSGIKGTIHFRSHDGGTICGLGGIRSTTDDPDKIDCSNCRRTYERNQATRRTRVAADLAELRKTVTAERDRRSEAASGASNYESQNRYWGWTDALDWVLALIDPDAERMARTERADYTD